MSMNNILIYQKDKLVIFYENLTYSSNLFWENGGMSIMG